MIDQAFVLGAGLGTRLRPLTDDLPKPLVPIFQKPLITFAFDHLIDLGVTRLFVNTHHRPERFLDVFRSGPAPAIEDKNVSSLSYRDRLIEVHHEPVLLETAGGIANIASSLGKGPLLVYNGDSLTDLPIERLVDWHGRSGNVVTLALRSNSEPRHIAMDSRSGRLLDIRNQLGTGADTAFMFAGIYVIERAFINRLKPGVKQSVIPHFLELIREQAKIGGIVIDEGKWWDVGNREAYLQLHRDLADLEFPSFPVWDPDWKAPVHASATVERSARLSGCSVIGAGCQVGAEAELEDTIVWTGAQIASRSHLSRCIVRSHRHVEGNHQDADI